MGERTYPERLEDHVGEEASVEGVGHVAEYVVSRFVGREAEELLEGTDLPEVIEESDAGVDDVSEESVDLVLYDHPTRVCAGSERLDGFDDELAAAIERRGVDPEVALDGVLRQLEAYASDHMADRSDVVYVDDPRNDYVTKFLVD